MQTSLPSCHRLGALQLLTSRAPTYLAGNSCLGILPELFCRACTFTLRALLSWAWRLSWHRVVSRLSVIESLTGLAAPIGRCHEQRRENLVQGPRSDQLIFSCPRDQDQGGGNPCTTLYFMGCIWIFVQHGNCADQAAMQNKPGILKRAKAVTKYHALQ